MAIQKNLFPTLVRKKKPNGKINGRKRFRALQLVSKLMVLTAHAQIWPREDLSIPKKSGHF